MGRSGRDAGGLWPWAAPALGVVLLTAAIGLWRYPALPDPLATHYGFGGRPDRFSPKSPLAAFALVLVQLALTGAFVVMARSFRRPDGPGAGTARALLALTACVDVTLLLVALLLWGLLPGWGGAGLVLLTAAPALFGAAWFVARAIRDGGTANAALRRDAHWRGGVFYVNRDDPALWVPKRRGLGWTLNLAHPSARLILAVLLALPLLALLLAAFAS